MMSAVWIFGLIILCAAGLMLLRGVLRRKCLGKCACCPFSGKCCRKNAVSTKADGGS